MFAIIGAIIVLGCVIGGFLLEGGTLHILIQPIEILIIGGAAVGAFVISSPKSVLFGTIKGAIRVLTAREPSKNDGLDILTCMFELASTAKRGGMVAVEPLVAKPESSALFGKYDFVAKNHEVRDFIADNFKVLLAGALPFHVFDGFMDVDVETQSHHEKVPSSAVTKVADSLPGLGIVAAVLGIVLTMGKLNEPPEVLGHSIGAALLGTFLGVLLCYGFVGPIATNLEHQAEQQGALLAAIKQGMLAVAEDLPPFLVAEATRRGLPGGCRPSMEEMEEACKRVPK
ncbi:flagellar motor stator protein MotA [Megalodesulfovibrio paquesii]